MTAGSMSRHLRNVHEILPKLRSETELSTSSQTSIDVSFLNLDSKYQLTEPLESRRSLMSKHGERPAERSTSHKTADTNTLAPKNTEQLPSSHKAPTAPVIQLLLQ